MTQRRIKAEVLLRFACEVYEAQMARGRHFLHEHLAGADSWQTRWVQRLRQDARVSEVIAHQCMLGQTTMGRLPVLKPTRFLSSAPALLDELNRKCSRDHLHHPLLGRSRAAAAAEYPAELCMAILKGIDAQRLREGLGPPQPALRALRLGVGLYDLSPDVSPPMLIDESIVQEHVKDEEEEEMHWKAEAEFVHDELTGEELPPELVKRGRAEECAFMESWGVWQEVPVSECWAKDRPQADRNAMG